MKLYLLTRKEGFLAGYDTYEGFVICAPSPRQARVMAAAKAHRESEWTNTDKTSCMLIGRPSGPITEPQILLSAYSGS